MPPAPITSIRQRLVFDYLRRFPSLPTLTIARLIRKEHPRVYPSLSAARKNIMFYRGEWKVRGRCRPHPVSPRTKEQRLEAQNHKWLLPSPEKTAWRRFRLPPGGKWLILSDAHFPFQDNKAINLALEYGYKIGCDSILFNGDMSDCYSLSTFARDPEVRRFPREVKTFGRFLDDLQSNFKPRNWIWKCGNHEDRLERYLMSHAAELFGLEAFTFKNFFNLAARGIQWVPESWPITCGALNILHGHEYRMRWASPVNPARGIFLRAGECTLVAHEHKTSEHAATTLAERVIGCWSQGCLCNLHPQYRPLNAWNHGFAILHTGGGGWEVENRKIVKGKIV